MMRNRNYKFLIAAVSLVIVFSANRVLADEIEKNKDTVESEEAAVQVEVAEVIENDIEDIAAFLEELENQDSNESDEAESSEDDENIEDEESDEDELEAEEEDEELEEEDEEVELVDQKITVKCGEHKFIVTGNMPENTTISVEELSNHKGIEKSITKSLDSSHGFFEIASFGFSFSYEFDGETKSFVPADFEEEYKVKVENIGDDITVFELGENNSVHIENSSFKMTDTTSVSFGIVYDYSTSLYGVLKDNPSSTIIAEGDQATYKTRSNERGEFLFTNIDYSKGFFGMCFEISVEG